MKRRDFIVGASIAIPFACHKGNPTQPEPPPSTLPTPEPPPTFPSLSFPVRAADSSFSQRIWGAIPLDKSKGWPLINQKGLDELAQYGVNWTHIRLGPHSLNGPDSDCAPVEDFWNRVEDSLSYAQSLGIAVEVDCIDCWVIKHGYNYYGWDISSVQTYPSQAQKQWIQQIIEHTRNYPNVMYQDGNEAGVIDATREWADGIRALLRPTGRLIATNTNRGTVQRDSDYIQRHQDGVLTPIAGKPTMVNETGPYLNPEEWEAQARLSVKAGTYFALWRGDMSEEQWKDALVRNAKLRQELGL